MNTSYLPSGAASILLSFRSCFSARSFPNFVALISGWILCRGTHTISRVLVAARGQGLAPKGHAAYYRFLSRARWDPDRTGRVLFSLLLPFLPKRIEAAVDDTLCRRSGPHLFGAGMHHDASSSTYGGSGGRRASFAYGHNWVVLSLWVAFPWNPRRGIALPVLLRLYRPKKRCPGGQYRKRTELAAEMLGLLCSWLPEGQALDVTGDGEYACKTLLRDLPPEVRFTGPMPLDAALYASPGRRAGRGRPRLKGKRLPSPARMAEGGTWTRAEVGLYGQRVTVLVQTLEALWYTVRGAQPVRVVLTRDPKGRWKDKAYFCTDPCLGAVQILERYAHRWQLEVTFQAAKQTMGLEEPRNGWWRRIHGRRADTTQPGPKPRGNRGRLAVERTVPLIFLAYGIVAIWFLTYGKVSDVVARQRQAKPWYGLKCEPAYADMLAALRREFWARRLSKNPSLRPHREKVLRLIEEAAFAA